MRNSRFWLILIGFMILLDIYVFQVVKHLAHNAAPKTRLAIYIAYWGFSLLTILVLLFLPSINDSFPKGVRNTLFVLVVATFFSKLVASVFFLVDDIRRLFQWGAGKIFFRGTEGESIQESDRISRSVFLSWLGLAAGGGLFTSLVYGLTNKYNYNIKKIPLALKGLPASFHGLRVVQLSDIHSGSFTDKAAVERGIEKVMKLNPDIVLFTGDLVNNTADEMHAYIDSFSKLKAPYGIYSVLGNHDYGDYVKWPTKEAKNKNLEDLKKVHADLGWRLLMNEHVVIEKGEEKIAVIGVENWSAKNRFPKYGDLSKAYAGTEQIPFKILLSHDPSHWEAEVVPKFPDIQLMLAGHTHGMQFGVEIPGLKWSPVQYVYKQWAGLYHGNEQKLYVNRGFGFIGYPGRVGILPEITLFELSS
jgi:predicted MPP superfamily phosphohydrolase